MTVSRREVMKSAALAGLSLVAMDVKSSVPAKRHEVLDNIVVGSGYGGAVAAYRLGKARQKVLLLEMGQPWNEAGSDGKIFTNMLQPDGRSVWLGSSTNQPVKSIEGIMLDQEVPYAPGILDYISLGNIAAYRGIGYGGGSLVNGGIALRPKRSTLQRISSRIFDGRFFNHHLPLAETRLGVNSIGPKFFKESEWYQYARVAATTAGNVGYKVESMQNTYDFTYLEAEANKSVPASALDGELIYGNNYGRRSLQQTYLRAAEATGRVTVQTLAEAVVIRALKGGLYEVEVALRDSSGAVVDVKAFRASRIFLAAGSVGTTSLLLKAQMEGTLPRLGAEIGKMWGPNGNVTLGRTNPENSPTGIRQSTIAVAGIDSRNQFETYSEVAPLPLGVETFISYYLSIASTNELAEVYLEGGYPMVSWSSSQSREAIEKTKLTFDRINDAEGTLYRDDLFGDEGKMFTDNWTYHPLGGVVLGHATSYRGRLRGHERIVVVDGSLLPGSIGVNPLLTITALAERIMDLNV